METFKIIDSERRNLPFAKTDYYQWLKSNGKDDVHFIGDKTQYLESKGFVLGVDKLSEDDLSTLKHIEQMYFYLEIINR